MRKNKYIYFRFVGICFCQKLILDLIQLLAIIISVIERVPIFLWRREHLESKYDDIFVERFVIKKHLGRYKITVFVNMINNFYFFKIIKEMLFFSLRVEKRIYINNCIARYKTEFLGLCESCSQSRIKKTIYIDGVFRRYCRYCYEHIVVR